MSSPKDDKFSQKEAQERFEAALRGGLRTAPAPLKNMTPKRKKAQRAKKKK